MNINRMYERLVQGEDDIVGHIAYSIYKSHKIKWIKQFYEKNGHAPDTEEMAPFVAIAESEEQCQFYAEHATTIAQNFLHRTLSEYSNENDRLNKEQYELRLEEVTHKIMPRTFMYGVWQSVFASFIFFAAGILLLLATGGWARIGKTLIQLAQ